MRLAYVDRIRFPSPLTSPGVTHRGAPIARDPPSSDPPPPTSHPLTRPDAHHAWLFACAGLEVERLEPGEGEDGGGHRLTLRAGAHVVAHALADLLRLCGEQVLCHAQSLGQQVDVLVERVDGALRVLHDQYPASAFAELGKHAKVVLDVGLNNGKDTEFFLRQGHAVVAVDANPQWVQAARARWASEIAARRLLVLCVGPRDTQTFKFLPRCE
mgnify:CR=1 FL=1